jgi:hypothetical protein
MRRLGIALLGMFVGYPVFAFAGYWAIGVLSGNHFDRSVEASMTAAFVIGPAGAIIGLVAGSILGKTSRPSTDVTGKIAPVGMQRRSAARGQARGTIRCLIDWLR